VHTFSLSNPYQSGQLAKYKTFSHRKKQEKQAKISICLHGTNKNILQH